MDYKQVFLMLLVIGMFSLVSAETFGYGRTETTPINYSKLPSVNNSIYWDGNTWSSIRWLDIDGGNANTNIDIGIYNFITTGTGTFGSTYQAVLGDDANGVSGSFIHGDYEAYLGTEISAGVFSDSQHFVVLADGTYAINAIGDSYFDGDVDVTGTGTFGGGLFDSSGNLAIDLDNRFLYDLTGTINTVDTDNCLLQDLSGYSSVDWANHQLQLGSTGEIMLDWGTTNLLDFKDNDITTTGTGTFGSTSAGIVLNDANSNFHIYGKTANDYGKVDTGIDFISVAKPDYISNLANLGAGNVDTGKHYYHVEFYTVWGSTGIKSYSSAPSITLAGDSEVRVTIPVSTDYRVTGRRIYRTIAGESAYRDYLLADIANNVATTYDDNIADATINIPGRTYAYTYPNKAVPLIMVDEAGALVASEGATSLGYQTGVVGDGVSIGDQAGHDLQATAFGNTLVGSLAGKELTTGYFNTFLGGNAGATATTGSGNVAIGTQTSQIATGSYNVAIGSNAGRYGSGSYNTFIGTSAGHGSAMGNSARNIGIGYSALDLLDDAGNAYNVAIGWQAGHTITTGQYNILLGKDAEPSSATASNEMVVTNINSADFGGANIKTTGRISSGTATITASSDTTDVSGINTLFVNTTAGDVTLGGLKGGVDGQKLSVVKIVAVNDLILEHEEGVAGSQDFFMHQLGDEIIDAGGVPIVYEEVTGTWFDCSHAKHI